MILSGALLCSAKSFSSKLISSRVPSSAHWPGSALLIWHIFLRYEKLFLTIKKNQMAKSKSSAGSRSGNGNRNSNSGNGNQRSGNSRNSATGKKNSSGTGKTTSTNKGRGKSSMNSDRDSMM